MLERHNSTGHVGGAGIVGDESVAYALEVQPEIVGHHEQLVGRREADVTPGVCEQLGQLRLLRLQLDKFRGEAGEQSPRPRHPLRRARGDDLRQLAQLGQRPALSDALGTEAHQVVEPPTGEVALDQGGDTGIDRAAKHDRLPGTEVIGKLRDGRDHGVRVGVEVFVNGSADHHHHVLGTGDHVRGGRRRQSRCRAQICQGSLGTVLVEGEASVVDGVDRRLIGVEEGDAHAALAKGDPQGETHVTAASHHHHVVFEPRIGSRAGSFSRRLSRSRSVGGQRRQPHMGRGDVPT